MREIIMLVLAFSIVGCSTFGPEAARWEPAEVQRIDPSLKYKFWKPSELDKAHAEELSRRFARSRLGISNRLVETMKTNFLCSYKDGAPTIDVAFFDPRYHAPDSSGHYSRGLGGFPTYFSVTVDPIRWRVIDHYASPE